MSLTANVDRLTPAEWMSATAAFSDHNIYQTWAFGEVSAAETGSQISRILVHRDDQVIGAAQLRIKRLPMIHAGLAYSLFGPVWRRPNAGPGDLRDVLKGLRAEYVDGRGLELRLVPNLWAEQQKELEESFLENGFAAASNEPVHRTMVVDLSPSLADLRKRLAQKWRNGLNQAEKRGVRVEAHGDAAAVERFESLYEDMWSKKQFETGVRVGSFRRLQHELSPREKLSTLLAFVGDELAAAHISSTLGDTCIYLLGASNDLGREYKASYLLQWKAMEFVQSVGAKWYDVGGIDPESNPGVYHFKAGLGGEERSLAGRFTVKAKGAGRFLVPLAERVYRAIGSLRESRDRKVMPARQVMPVRETQAIHAG